ncbi:putative nuclease HARBI1 isoform X1 [Achroia grisella]|uniref:putative nuclease HARBI1 isoform X1 n=2 Tax=Achroia grisella TaxID=688607 RepID=UPI0027D1EEC7|nr:putative nuclease HARBI1 isoform X1 [Achroia grisella]
MARLAGILEALNEEEIERRRFKRKMRTRYLQRSIPDFEFVSKYRLSRELFENLCQDVVRLLPPTKNSRAIDPITKILTALNFYASGSYQGAVGQNLDTPMAQQSVSNCIRDVTDALNTPYVLRKYIRFPQSREDRNVLKRNFATQYGIPGVIGCIDCTHVAIIRPTVNEERFFNRKHYHSLNVQVIADSNLKIMNIDASYGGATHDAFIWEHSEIKDHLESLQGETTYLLGDSGYPLRVYLMTPYENAVEDSPEDRYNSRHMRTRNTVERVFGVLKSRWRCLLAARELHYAPRAAGRISIACAVLHNMCIDQNLTTPDLSSEDINYESARQPSATVWHQSSTAALDRGRATRNSLIQRLEQSR